MLQTDFCPDIKNVAKIPRNGEIKDKSGKSNEDNEKQKAQKLESEKNL